MRIEILGTGCKKCRKTEEIIQKIVKEKGVNVEIIKIEDLGEIIERGVMVTPAVIVDGKVKIVGYVPSKNEIENLLN